VGTDVRFKRLTTSLEGQELVVSDQQSSVNLKIPLLGEHQAQNAATAYAALRASGIDMSADAIQTGFSQVQWRARFEVARQDPPVIFDSAHNQDSFAKLRTTLDEHFPAKQVYLIFGASEEKNIPGMFAEMKPRIRKLIVTRADHPRALEPEHIRQLANQAGLESETVGSVENAFRRALDLSEKDGSIVLSAGSMFVTAEVMKAWNKFNG
jgi:dihydrofolate synthase/folylpolyglutamate synthase